MKCPRCGEENEAGTKICKYCRRRITTDFGAYFIVFSILAVCAAIAIPNFKSGPSKNDEAKQNLGAIFTAYTSYHSNYGTYPSAPLIKVGQRCRSQDCPCSAPDIQFGNTIVNCIAITGWEPKGQIRYNYNCMNTEVFSPATNDSPCPPGIYTSATKDSFTIAACGNVDNDTTVDVWTIDDARHLRNVVDDVKK
jgi:hypothetical protein